jgi:hypothetical protein
MTITKDKDVLATARVLEWFKDFLIVIRGTLPMWATAYGINKDSEVEDNALDYHTLANALRRVADATSRIKEASQPRLERASDKSIEDRRAYESSDKSIKDHYGYKTSDKSIKGNHNYERLHPSNGSSVPLINIHVGWPREGCGNGKRLTATLTGSGLQHLGSYHPVFPYKNA